MLDTYELVLAVVSARRKVEGRTLLQKLGYFVSEVQGIDAGYGPHLYGPYSSAVRWATEELVGAGALLAREEQFDSRAFPGHEAPWTRHSYELTDRGREFLELLREKRKTEFDEAREIAERVLEVTDNYRLLSWAAKAHFLLPAGETRTYDQVVEEAQDLGWQMCRSDVEKGAEVLLRLGLIARGAGT
jgi:uncharacterized protein YwgA